MIERLFRRKPGQFFLVELALELKYEKITG